MHEDWEKKKNAWKGENIYIYKLASRAILQSVTDSGTLSCAVNKKNGVSNPTLLISLENSRKRSLWFSPDHSCKWSAGDTNIWTTLSQIWINHAGKQFQIVETSVSLNANLIEEVPLKKKRNQSCYEAPITIISYSQEITGKWHKK